MNISSESFIASTRFGLGARPGEAASAQSDPRAYLADQLTRPQSAAITNPKLPSSTDALSKFFELNKNRKKAKSGQKKDKEGASAKSANKDRNMAIREIAAKEIEARTLKAALTQDAYLERLVRFWSNHFTVSMTTQSVRAVAGAFEREAIRPFVTGKFHEMLQAVETHQAMLLYLDNAQSTGPNSTAGKRRKRGLNENLAREILELHTLGVDGGYSQSDVTEFARALTGWSVGGRRTPELIGRTVFDERRHEPGSRLIMGQRFAESGKEQAPAILKHLAFKAETAHFIAGKLVRHFISDQAPEKAVASIEKVFMETGGDLAQVSKALIDSDEAWAESQQKFKSPDEFFISSLRGLGFETVRPRYMRSTYTTLGQAPFTAPSPAGWPDETAAWLSPDAMKKRLEWSSAVAGRVAGRKDPRVFLQDSLGPLASERTQKLVKGADSREQGLVLALMSPEFQRR